MAYLVLARKYRPESFAEMIGQGHITRTIANAIRDDRVHHAYLFCGVRGIGKTTAARILAKCLVCEAGPTSQPCNACEQCRAVNEARSVDVIEIDGASNNKVEHVRALREQVNYLPQSARRKVYIIDEVHMLTDSAFNALLKTLEEPPAHVTFIFATTDPQKVLPTILSRVSRLDFRRVRTNELVDHLRALLGHEGIEAEDEGLGLVARASEGSVRDALTLLDKVIAFAETQGQISASEVRTILGHADRFAVAELFDAILRRDATATVGLFDEITATGSDLLQLAVSILQHIRDLTVVKLCKDPQVLVDVSEGLYSRLVEQADGVESVVLAQHFDRFSRVLEGLETSQIPRLAIEMGLLELVNSEPLVPIGQLVDRLSGLSSGAAPTGGSAGGPASGTAGGSAGGRSRDREGRGATNRSAASASPSPSSSPSPSTSSPQPLPSRSAPSSQPSPGSVEVPQPAIAKRNEPQAAPSAPTPSPEAASPSPDATLSAKKNLEPPADLPQSQFAKELWGMVNPTLSEDSEASTPPSPGPTSGSNPGPNANRARTPNPASSAGSDPAFSLRPADEPVPPSPPAPPPADLGCPSSRCTPREPIPWKTLAPFEAWEALLDHIRQEDELLFAVLGEFGLSELSLGALELAAPSSSFARDQLDQRPELKSVLHRAIEEHFGESLELRFLDATPSLPELPSLVLVEDSRVAARQAEVESQANQNPRIRALLAAFNGTVRAVVPLDGTPPEDSGASQPTT